MTGSPAASAFCLIQTMLLKSIPPLRLLLTLPATTPAFRQRIAAKKRGDGAGKILRDRRYFAIRFARSLLRLVARCWAPGRADARFCGGPGRAPPARADAMPR